MLYCKVWAHSYKEQVFENTIGISMHTLENRYPFPKPVANPCLQKYGLLHTGPKFRNTTSPEVLQIAAQGGH